jgi:hypothetical protein
MSVSPFTRRSELEPLRTPWGRPLKVLFLGNDDNLNFRLAKWSRELGVEADLWIIQDPDPLRGDIRLLLEDDETAAPPWVRNVPFGDGRRVALRPGALGRKIDAAYDFVGVAGPASLMASLRLRRPRGLWAIGAEIGDLPFPFHPGYALSQGRRPLRYNASVALLVRAALRRLEFVVDSYQAHDDRYRRLGLEAKRIFMGFPADALGERRLVRPGLRAELMARYGGARRLFLWFSRLNFRDQSSLIYKGPELYLEALESVLAELQSGAVRLVIGRHGNEVDVFVRRVEASPVAPYVDWVGHLGTADLLTYLSLPNAVLFAEFGATQRELSGIGRDAASMGTICVSSADTDSIRRQYGTPAPLLRATNSAEIARTMRELLEMSDGRFRAQQAAMRRFGEHALDFRSVLPRYYARVQDCVARYEGRP